MLKSRLCDYSDVYILVSGTIKVATEQGYNPNNVNKEVVIKNCTPFTDCISVIDNTQTDNSKNIAAVMSMYNLI